MDTNKGAEKPDTQGNDTNHGRAAFATGTTTGGGSNYGQGSHDTGGSPYRQGTVQSDGANYESEADRLGVSTTGTRAEGSQSPDAGAPGQESDAAARPTTPEQQDVRDMPKNLAEDDIEHGNRSDQRNEVDRKDGE